MNIKNILYSEKTKNLIILILTTLAFWCGYNISIESLPVNVLKPIEHAQPVDSSSIDSTTLFLNPEDTINQE